MPRRPLLRLLVLAAAALTPGLAHAQRYPDRPITMIVPYAPGGSADVLARVIAPAMGHELGESVVVELRGGAGGNIGAAYVAQTARADGYTLLFASISLATAPAMSTIGFDPLTDLLPVAGVGAVPNLLVVSPMAPYRTLPELLAAARARPGEISFGSSGLGTGSHLAGELLAAAADVQLLHVPYRGSGAVYPDLIAGRVTMLLDAMGSAIGQVQAGAVRPLAITSTARSAVLPEVPAVAETLPGYEASLWFGFFARAGTPPEALARLEAAARAALHTGPVQDRLRGTGPVQDRLRQAAAMPIPEDAAGFGRYYRADVERWQGMVRSGRLQRLD